MHHTTRIAMIALKDPMKELVKMFESSKHRCQKAMIKENILILGRKWIDERAITKQMESLTSRSVTHTAS